MLTESF